MAQVKVNGYWIEIDIADELADYAWTKPRWTSEKLLAASPFRYDSTPSFFVDLTSGGWHDSGAYDAEYESGTLPKLLAFLRNETYEETCEYLISVYGYTKPTGGDFTFSIPKVSLKPESLIKSPLDERVLEPYKYRHRYLESRGINEATQQFMGVGFSRVHKAITLPWRNPNGKLANVKYRKVLGKVFWYESGGVPVRNLVYGIDKVYKHNLKRVIICEAEIDALSWYTCGVPAIALGGTAVTKAQIDIIRRSPIETAVIVRDNDKPGEKMERKLVEGLQGAVALEYVRVPAAYNDSNEYMTAGYDLAELPFSDNLNYLFDRNVQV